MLAKVDAGGIIPPALVGCKDGFGAEIFYMDTGISIVFTDIILGRS